MNDEQKKILVKAIEQTTPWTRIQTNIEGIYIVKSPTHNDHQSVFIELNPSAYGIPLKKRGIFIKTHEELEAIKKLCENEKLDELIDVLNQYYSTNNVPKIEL